MIYAVLTDITGMNTGFRVEGLDAWAWLHTLRVGTAPRGIDEAREYASIEVKKALPVVHFVRIMYDGEYPHPLGTLCLWRVEVRQHINAHWTVWSRRLDRLKAEQLLSRLEET